VNSAAVPLVLVHSSVVTASSAIPSSAQPVKWGSRGRCYCCVPQCRTARSHSLRRPPTGDRQVPVTRDGISSPSPTPRSLSRGRGRAPAAPCRGPRPAWAQPKARAKAEPNPMLPRDAAPPHVDSCPEPRRRGARAGAGGSWALAARHATREPEPGAGVERVAARGTRTGRSRPCGLHHRVADFERNAVAGAPHPHRLWNELHLHGCTFGASDVYACLSQRLRLFQEVVVVRSVRTENI
jgi:hypothetical protein